MLTVPSSSWLVKDHILHLKRAACMSLWCWDGSLLRCRWGETILEHCSAGQCNCRTMLTFWCLNHKQGFVNGGTDCLHCWVTCGAQELTTLVISHGSELHLGQQSVYMAAMLFIASHGVWWWCAPHAAVFEVLVPIAPYALQSLTWFQYWNGGVSCDIHHWHSHEAPPSQYWNYGSDCSV